MQEPDLFLLFAYRFNRLQLNYFVTGSIASIIYGEPRLTHDINIVLEIHTTELATLIDAFPEEQFYFPPIEIIKNEILRTEHGHFNIIHHDTGFKADIYPAGKDNFLRWGLDNKKKIPYKENFIYVASPEYVIIKKLEFYREGHSEKHLSDVKNIMINSGKIIDCDLVERFAKEFGLSNYWNEVRTQG